MSTAYKRRRLSPEERREREQNALARARGSLSLANFAPVIIEFTARGIDPAEIKPKENVFGYDAWRALGRQVRKGEHGVRLAVWAPVELKNAKPLENGEQPKRLLCVGASVFHISQTDAIEGGTP